MAGRPTVELPARAVLVAAGTSPNVTYEKECPGTFQLDDHSRSSSSRTARSQDGRRAASTWSRTRTASSRRTTPSGRFVSYYGDNHPRYAGNVVKAMASAKDGYPHVVALFDGRAGDARSGGAGRSATRAWTAPGRARSTTS